MQKFENLEYADELYKIQLKFTEGNTEPLNSDEIDTLIGILREQLEIMNGEDDDTILNEDVLKRLKTIQDNSLLYDREDILEVLRMVEDKEIQSKMIKEYYDMDIDTIECYDMLKGFLEIKEV